MMETLITIAVVIMLLGMFYLDHRGSNKAKKTLKKRCTYCKGYMAYDATACPHCGRRVSGFGGWGNEVKAGWMSFGWIFKLLIAIIVIAFAVAFIGDLL